jgi:hypothetical protein
MVGAAYSKAIDLSAMARVAGDHAQLPSNWAGVRAERNTDDCESGRKSEGAHTSANHGTPRVLYCFRFELWS